MFIKLLSCIKYASRLLVAMAAYTVPDKPLQHRLQPTLQIVPYMTTQSIYTCQDWVAFAVPTLASAMAQFDVERTGHHPERLQEQTKNREEVDLRNVVPFTSRSTCAVRRR